MTDDPAADVALIQRIAAVPTLLSVCLQASGMGIVAIARVTADRWIACAVLDRMGFGLVPGGELPVETTLCGRVRDARVPIVIEHASQEAAWCDHPTPRAYGYESHVSVPIILPDGEVFGTLVAIDPRPLPVRAPDTLGAFTLLADLLAFHVDAARRLEASEASLARERAESALREQFIAVLGHDLRNPLAAIGAGARILGREPQGGQARAVLDLMDGAVGRMAGLVDEALDFARGRLGGGIPVAMLDEVDLRPLLAQIVAELRVVWPDRVVEADLDGLAPLRCDPARLGQMLSNLLGNALVHGAADRPVRVAAGLAGDGFTLVVENGGEPIPEAVLAEMFEPFRRGPSRDNDREGGREVGLGLGLYIAAQIARAHGGEISARSGADGTRLAFTMPLARPAQPMPSPPMMAQVAE